MFIVFPLVTVMDYGQNKYFKTDKLRWFPIVLFLNNYLIHNKKQHYETATW